VIDPPSRIRRLTASWEPRFREEFLAVVDELRTQVPMRDLEDLLARGRFEDAVGELRRASERLGAVWVDAFIGAGAATAGFLGQGLAIAHVSFGATAPRAATLMRQNALRIADALTESGRASARAAITRGLATGANPREVARAFRDSIGLTDAQAAAVENYRRMLQEGDGDALRRELRDARSDRSVRRAMADGEPLPQAQVDQMVERYRQNMLAARADAIAQDEALGAVNEGSAEAYAQLQDAGDLGGFDVVRTWHTTGDGRVRDSHAGMEGQQRPLGVPFTTGAGYQIMHPHDSSAPASEVVNCRCALGAEVVPAGEAA